MLGQRFSTPSEKKRTPSHATQDHGVFPHIRLTHLRALPHGGTDQISECVSALVVTFGRSEHRIYFSFCHRCCAGRIISGDLGDHTKLRFLSKLPSENTKVWNTSQTSLQHWIASEASWGTLCCRSSPLRAMNIRPSAIASSSEMAFTVPRLRRLLQMGAAIGWLQRNSSRSEEGRVSWPGRSGNSSRSSEGRVLGPRIGWLQRTVAKCLSADREAASPFQRMLGDATDTVQMSELSSEKETQKGHKHRARSSPFQIPSRVQYIHHRGIFLVRLSCRTDAVATGLWE